jgi:hypothetical protein
MKLRRSRTPAAAVLGFWAVLAGDVVAAEASAGRSRVVARGVIAPALAKTRPHGGKGRRGHENAGGPAITFTGFHVFEDGRSRIFVKLTNEVPVEARYSGRKVEYLFRGAKIPIRNNKNPLITEHFPASIVSARYAADKKGKGRDKSADARLEIVLREESKPVHKVERQGDGTAIFTVDLPKPSTPPPPAPVPTPPAPKQDRGDN